MKLKMQKLDGWGYRMVKFHNPNFNRFSSIHPSDGQTDGRAIACSALSIFLRCRAL